MDEMEEFEIRPLTKGLGFHKKAISLKDKVEDADLFKSELTHEIPAQAPSEALLSENVEAKESETPDVDPSVDEARKSLDDIMNQLNQSLGVADQKEEAMKAAQAQSTETSSEEGQELEITMPLPRDTIEDKPRPLSTLRETIEPLYIESSQPIEPMSEPEAPAPTPRPQPKVDYKKMPSMDPGVKRGASDGYPGKLKPAAVSFSSAILDFVVVVAFSLIFLVSLLMVTEIEVFSVFASAKNDFYTQLSLFVLFVAIMQMYVVVSRSFFGKTLGEWTFDFQLGEDRQHSKATYPLAVVARSFVVTLTGVITLPLLSFITRKDIAGSVTGLQLYQLKR